MAQHYETATADRIAAGMCAFLRGDVTGCELESIIAECDDSEELARAVVRRHFPIGGASCSA